MSRIGFDKGIHPYQLQLRICSFPDTQGIQNRNSVTLNLQEGRITSYYTDEDQVSTAIKEYVASDDELKELYDFLTVDAIEQFKAMPDSEKSQYEIGYYDWASLRYLMVSKDGQISDGSRHRVYSNDPIEMAIQWMRKTSPFGQDFW